MDDRWFRLGDHCRYLPSTNFNLGRNHPFYYKRIEDLNFAISIVDDSAVNDPFSSVVSLPKFGAK